MPSKYKKVAKKSNQKIEYLNIHVNEYNLLQSVMYNVRRFLLFGGWEEKEKLQRSYKEYTEKR